MKQIRLLATSLFFVLCCTLPNALGQIFKAQLTGRSEVPPVLSSAYGSIEAELIADTLIVSGSFSNLGGELATSIAGGAHIHMGYAGRTGGVIFPLNVDADSSLLNGTFSPDSNRFVLSPAQMAALNERALYVNIHSTAVTSGELRGQLAPDATDYFSTVMYSSYQNNHVMSGGHGALFLDLDGDTLTVSGTVNNMSSPLNVDIAGGMHLHNAYAGQNGGVQIPLVVDTDTSGMNGIVSAAKNTYILTPGQRSSLNERRFYANIHTIDNPSGELRGQVSGMAQAVFRAQLSGTNQLPFVTTRAIGMAIAELMPDSTIVVSGSFDGITSSVDTTIAGGAHIHMAVAGRNGGVQFPLNIDLNPEATAGVLPSSNVFALSADQYNALIARGFYVNIHSGQIGSGEIRGQLLPESQMAFTINLSSVNTMPNTISDAAGLIKAEYTNGVLTLSGSFGNLISGVDTSIAGGAHIHMAMTGSTGGVIFPLNLRFDPDLSAATLGSNVFSLNEGQQRALLNRGLYVNIHTKRVPSGELRGQILPEATAYFFASLAGSHQTTPVNSPAVGQAALEIYRASGAGILSGSFRDLEGELATNIAGGIHIHSGYNGQNGPVIVPIGSELMADLKSGVIPAANNHFDASPGFMDTLFSLGHYVNVHSSLHTSGELRGQLLPTAFAHFNAVLHSMNEVQPVPNTGAHGALSAILTGTTLRVSGSFAGLEGLFAENIAGGAHIHGGYVGMNAGIAVPLRTTLEADLKSGTFRADTGYVLTIEQVRQLNDGGMYVNVHSSAYNGGELRGQLLSNFNSFPNATSELTSPEPGTTIMVSSGSTDPLFISWTTSEDRDSLAYIIQVTPDPTFTTIPIQVNTGGQTTFSSVTLGNIDTLLASLGVPIGFPLTVQARVIATDGSLRSTGQVQTFSIVRQSPSEVLGLPDGWRFDVFPTLTRGEHLTLELDAPNITTSDLRVLVVSASGQVQASAWLDRYGQQAFRTTIDPGELTPGMWMICIEQSGTLVAQRRILVLR